MKAFHGRRLGAHLIAEGMCPPNASAVEVHIPADGAAFLRFDVLLDAADLPRLIRALAATEAELTAAPAPAPG